MWTDATRAHHARAGLALPSDLTDDEWAVLKPFLPPPSGEGGVDIHQFLGLEPSPRPRRLRAVAAVFGATAGLDRQQGA